MERFRQWFFCKLSLGTVVALVRGRMEKKAGSLATSHCHRAHLLYSIFEIL